MFRLQWVIVLGTVLLGCNGNGTTNGNGNGNGEAQIVLIEIDRMAGLPAFTTAQMERLAGLFAPAGLSLDIKQDQSDIPHRETVSVGDLHGLMDTHSSLPAPPGAWKLHVLIVTEDSAGDSTLGIMFDHGSDDTNDRPREGCAVFATPHAGYPSDELLLTTAHELAHCFNAHHTDWEGASFGSGASIESYSFADTSTWKISAKTVTHIKDHKGLEVRLVRPGEDGLDFGMVTQAHLDAHQSDPNESYSVVDPANLRRIRRGAPVPREALVRYHSSSRGAKREPVSGLRLSIRVPKTTYIVGEPIYLTAELKNAGAKSVDHFGNLDPADSFLNVEIAAGDGKYAPYRPATWRCLRRKPSNLEPGGVKTAAFPIFFGAQGWTFTKAGMYKIRADCAGVLVDGKFGDRALSNTLTITIQNTSTAKRVRPRAMRHDVGLYLYFQGAAHLEKAEKELEKLYKDTAISAAQRSAYGLALGLGKARIDKKEAQRYLQEVEKMKGAKLNKSLIEQSRKRYAQRQK